jgi:hypothetical protein
MSAPYNFPAYPGFSPDPKRKGISLRDLIFLHAVTGLCACTEDDDYNDYPVKWIVTTAWDIADAALEERVKHYNDYTGASEGTDTTEPLTSE